MLRWMWTKEQEYSLCDLVASTEDMRSEVKASGRPLSDYWCMIAGIMWQLDGVRATGGGCYKRWQESRARYAADMQERMERERDAAETVALAVAKDKAELAEMLAPLDDAWNKVRLACEMAERELAEATYDRAEEVLGRVEVIEEAVLTVCRELGVKVTSWGERRNGGAE